MRHDYFETIDAPVKAYIAGLLAADGNVLEQQQRVTLELAVRDHDLVLFVRDQLARGLTVLGRVRPTGTTTAILAMTSRQLCRDLARHGITPRKSLTLEWPETIDEPLHRLFLLGYFDGDGFVTWSRNGRYLYPRWALLGTRAFLSRAMQVIATETGIEPRVIRERPESRIHVLHINGRDASTVDEWLHSGTELGLGRKRLVTPSPGHASGAR